MSEDLLRANVLKAEEHKIKSIVLLFSLLQELGQKRSCTMRYQLTPVRMAIIKKNLQPNNKCWEGAERREPSYTAGDNGNWYSLYVEQYYGGSWKKLKIELLKVNHSVLSDPLWPQWSIAYQAPPSGHGIFQATGLEWVAISFSRGPSWPRDRSLVSCLVGRHFYRWATRELLYDSAIPLLGIYSEKSIIQKDTRTPMFVLALFAIARTWKQPKCLSTDEWIMKM